MHYSLVYLANTSRSWSMCKTLQPGSWREWADMITSPLFSVPYIGSPCQPELIIKYPFSPFSVSMAMSPLSWKRFQHSLWSSNTNRLWFPMSRPNTMGDRAFCSRLWNSLPDHLRSPQTVESFKKTMENISFLSVFISTVSLWDLSQM